MENRAASCILHKLFRGTLTCSSNSWSPSCRLQRPTFTSFNNLSRDLRGYASIVCLLRAVDFKRSAVGDTHPVYGGRSGQPFDFYQVRSEGTSRSRHTRRSPIRPLD